MANELRCIKCEYSYDDDEALYCVLNKYILVGDSNARKESLSSSFDAGTE